MNWKEILQKRLKAKRQILFTKDDPEINQLNTLIEVSNRKAVILWALQLASQLVTVLEEKYPDDYSGTNCFEMARLWSSGKIKMPEAKRAILDCHNRAKLIDNKEDIALYHAVAQGCSTIHTTRHAIGLVIYELTAVIAKNDLEDCDSIISKRISEYIDLLEYWNKQYSKENIQWAKFIK